MIERLEITDPESTPLPYLKNVPNVTGVVWDFKPGVNVLWGPNGSGKSTVLQLLGQVLHAVQGGVSTFTSESLLTVKGKLSGVSLRHDGQPILFCDPNHAVGTVGGMAGFDFDFMSQGVANVMFKGSAGETVVNRLTPILHTLAGKEPFPTKWATRVGTPPREVAQFLLPSCANGPGTVLLDEPDRNLSLEFQAGSWRSLLRMGERFQLIIASHSPFALNHPEVNYIDVQPGYLQRSLQVLRTYLVPSILTERG